MAARPELVREALQRQLPPNARSLSAAIAAGQKSFVEAGGPRAYFDFLPKPPPTRDAAPSACWGDPREAVMIELARSAG
jgi:creatinine amidohydrolase